jgi:ABC-2 type transport system permease protein
MQLERIYAIVLRQWYLTSGSLTRIIPMFIWFGIDIVLWGFITRYFNSVNTVAGDYTAIFLGAVLLWDFLIRVMQGTTMAFMEDTWSRNFLNLFATPISIYEYLSGLVLSSIITSCIVLFFMLIISTTVFGLSFMAYGLMVIPFMLVLFLFGIALGVLGCAIMLRLGPAAEWFVWPIPALLSPFACVFYPKAILPVWMQTVSVIIPPSYVFETMRSLVKGGAVDMTGLWISLALAVGYILLACWFFATVYGHALRSGLIARYSAETVS